MTPIDALIELLARVGTNRDADTLISSDELNQWPEEAVKAMTAQGLISKSLPATSAICHGCESGCTMPVHTFPGSAGDLSSFIVCDKRSDINRVPISGDRLVQWQCNAESICAFIAASLGLRARDGRAGIVGMQEIGIAFGKKRHQMLCLHTQGELTLDAGGKRVPLTELVKYELGIYTLDRTMISQLVDAATTADQRYTPTIVKREKRKLDTQTMYDSWNKEYRALKKKSPNRSDTWYAMKISKMDIALGRKPETIRRFMKK